MKYLKDWAAEWLIVYKKNRIKYSTYESYCSSITHIPHYLTINCSIIDIQRIINDMFNNGYALSTIKHLIVVIKQCFKQALLINLVDTVPDMSLIILPRCPAKEIQSICHDDIIKLIDYLHYDECQYNDLFLFLLYTGVRVGEALALRWSDIDLCNNKINITNTNYRGHIQSAKTATSARTIPIIAPVRTILIERPNIFDRDRFIYNYNYWTLRDAWRRVCIKCNINICGMHALRHTYATQALRDGVNIKVLSALLGHTKVSTTLDIYCSTSFEDKQKEVEKINFF